MIAFLDTSALVKLYVEESGSQTLQERLGSTPGAVSLVTYGEAYATFCRRRREGLFSDRELQHVLEGFEKDWKSLIHVSLSAAALNHIPRLCREYPLRGADALQLACASTLIVGDLDVLFVASDRDLLKAAARESIETFNPENP